ncbi:MAG: M1 family peptidase, partial [Deltaproteobacteria bacterium]
MKARRTAEERDFPTAAARHGRRRDARARRGGAHGRALFALLTALAALSSACASAPPTPPPGAADVSPPIVEAPPVMPAPERPLTDVVRPTRYTLSLDVDPCADRFRGTVTIELTLAAATRDLALNARGLRLERPRIRAGALEHSLVPFPGDHGVLVLRAPTPLPAGPAVLEIGFEGDLGEAPVGLYKVADGGAWYAFTQFEAMDARRAFPCFDQPDLKAPFAITLRVPRGMTAFSNGREVAREDVGELTAFTFAETPPLSTYLVAFAVGDLVVRPAPPSAAGLPIRVVTTRDKAGLTDYAAAQTAPVVDALVAWFGTAFPFEKLDLVAVPNFAAGAMENAGLVTFREEALLVAPDAPVARRGRVLITLAHELAHMWFGDLVTMAWWDDIWLNEAFATWLSWKIAAEVAPELATDVRSAGWRAWAMDADARESARAIRQPIASLGDIRNAFDAITYVKGANVLGMLERWLGAEPVRRGVQAYLAARPYGVGTTDDLLAALDAAAQRDVTAVASSWLDRPGSPLVDATLDCSGGGSGALKLRQRRYFADGPRPVETPWRVPFCVRYPDGPGIARECLPFDTVEATFPLAGARCPAWLVPNDAVRGFYRVRLADRDLDALLAAPEVLEPREQIALLGELEDLVIAGEQTPERLAQALTRLAPTRNAEVLGAVGTGLGFLRRLTPPAARPRFARY